MDRWKEHFQDLLNRSSLTDPNALNNKDKLPCNADMDIPPSLEEIEDAIKSLKNGKAPGADGIPSEVYKYGGPRVVQTLHSFFKTCWDEAELPQDFKDAKIVTIFKKGDRSQCGNYRGISLLLTAGKILAKVLLSRLQQAANKILPESQCGFRANRSTIDAIVTLRQLQEKSIEQQRPCLWSLLILPKHLTPSIVNYCGNFWTTLDVLTPSPRSFVNSMKECRQLY